MESHGATGCDPPSRGEVRLENNEITTTNAESNLPPVLDTETTVDDESYPPHISQNQPATSPRRSTNFTDLPYEMFMYITSFLEARAVLVLSKVCTKFQEWLSDEQYWRSRLMRRWPVQFPALKGESVDWKEACIEREELHRYWYDWSNNVEKVEIRPGLSQCIDAVHIKSDSNLLLVGGRDRYLSVYNTQKLCAAKSSPKSALVFEEIRTHKGWIWCIKARDQSVITTAWDEKLRYWTLGESELVMDREIPLTSAVLCATFLESTDCVAATTYDRTVNILDRRCEDAKVMKMRSHRRPVLRVCTLQDPHQLITASEDRSVMLWDRRINRSPVSQFKFSDAKFGYPRCLAHHLQGQLWVGDSRGLIHLMRVGADAITLEHSYELACVRHLIEVRVRGQGLLATASQRESIRIWHPTQPPLEVCHLKINSDQDLASMDFTAHAFAVGGGNGVVTYWSEKNEE